MIVSGLSVVLSLVACGESPSSDGTAPGQTGGARLGPSPSFPDEVPIARGVRALTADERQAAEAFYSRRTVSIVVGSGAGGGFDTTARLVSPI